MKTMIIAEAGVNHNAEIKLAFELVEVAKAAGADYVKFQTAIPERVVSRYASMAKYQIANTGKEEKQLEMTKRLHLPLNDFILIRNFCEQNSIGFATTAFDLESLDFVINLGTDFLKVPSGEITNFPYLRTIAQVDRKVLVSTGMCTLKEIGDVLDVLEEHGQTRDKISLLHCTTEYPAPYPELNLRALHTLQNEFKLAIGYSDHSLGIEASIAAVAMGASIVEKHFTLSKTLPGPDHKASLEPNEIAELVKSIRIIEVALGSAKKEPSQSEIHNIEIARKSIVASKTILKGEKLTEKNLTTKRPGNGISPMEWNSILNTVSKRDYLEDDQIEW